jgi:hypothetical protein
MARLGKFFYISVAPTFDSDAQAFFDRVTTAGGTLTTTEKQAVNQLVITMKADGTWGPCKVIYPMVGASAAACAQNLKSSSFTGTFTSGWTFASTGVTGNGTSAYMDTGLNPSSNLAQNSISGGAYVNANATSGNTLRTDVLFGASNSSFDNGFYLLPMANSDNKDYSRANQNTASGVSSWTDPKGFFQIYRTSSSVYVVKRNTTNSNLTVTSSTPTSNNVWVSALNNVGSIVEPSNNRIAFVYLGDGLTDTQASDFYTAVQAFQTTLARQIAP